MLLTDDLIERIHTFRLERMRLWINGLKATCVADGLDHGGGFVSFAGHGSPRSQAYGIGHRGAEFDLNLIEGFFKGLAPNWELIVTPFCTSSVLREAARLGYAPRHFRSVLATMTTDIRPDPLPNVRIEEVSSDLDLWIRTSDAGWTGADQLADNPSEVGKQLATSSARRYLAWLDGEPAATASLIGNGEISSLGGACTRVQFRNRGLQSLLTQRRLADVGPHKFVQVTALPGSQSHRNLQRLGFQPLYSKLVFTRHLQEP